MIPIAKPFLGEEEVAAAGEVLSSGWVSQGPKVKEFEDAFAAYVGAKHACAVSSCTTALHLALLARGVKPGDVVITVSHSFIATANCVRYCGAEPLFVDIDPKTYNMSPQSLEKFLDEECDVRGGKVFYTNVSKLVRGESPFRYFVERNSAMDNIGRVAAILVVHQMGMPCDMDAILPLARKFNLPVIEDAACAAGSEISLSGGKTWDKIGKPHGDIACFSFHPRKIITTGEGGMITTNNEEYDARFRLLRQQGMSVSDTVRHNSSKVIVEEYVTTGHNYRMTDIQAAIGVEQLKKLPGIIARRRQLAAFYLKALEKISWAQPAEEYNFCRTNWQSFPIRIAEDFKKNPDEIMQFLLDDGISTRPGIMNIHQERPYSSGVWWGLPESKKARGFSILLPLYHSLSEEDQINIVTALKRAVA